MTQEEFQRIVLNELKDLRQGQVKLEQGQVKLEQGQVKLEQGQVKLEQSQNELKERMVKVEQGYVNLEQGQKGLEQGQLNLEQGQNEMRKDIKVIIEQTAILTEFREEANLKLDKLNDKFNTLEIVTSQNWNDLARIRAAR